MQSKENDISYVLAEIIAKAASTKGQSAVEFIHGAIDSLNLSADEMRSLVHRLIDEYANLMGRITVLEGGSEPLSGGLSSKDPDELSLLQLSFRTINHLLAENIRYLDELVQTRKRELSKILQTRKRDLK